MPANISEMFKYLGIKESEARIYSVCLESKDGLKISEIATQTGIRRSAVNLIIERLLQRGFLSYYLEGQRKVFTAQPPELFFSNLENSLKEFKNFLPLFKDANLKTHKTKVRFFDGPERVEEIFNDIILTLKISKGEKGFLCISSGKDILTVLPQHQKQFIDKRVKEQISVRWIAPDDKDSRKFLETAKEELRQMKFVDPQKYPFHLDMNIYGHKISVLSLEGKPAGIIIENEILASSFRSLFNLLWDSL